MKKNVAIGLGVVSVAAWYSYDRFFGAVNKLQTGSIKFKGVSFGWTAATINIDLPIINPTKTVLPFDGFRGYWQYNDRRLADVVVEKWQADPKTGAAVKVSIPIEAQKQIIVPVQVKINYFLAVGQITDMINNGQFLGASLVKGVLTSGGLSFNVESKVF
jgi:hypothetical protein